MRGGSPGGAVKERKLQAFADGFGTAHNRGSSFRAEDFAAGLAKQRQPAFEMGGHDALLARVGHDGIALVTAARQHDRGPKIGQLGQVLVPIGNGIVENGTDFGVAADLGVKAVNQISKRFVGNLGLERHGFADSFLPWNWSRCTEIQGAEMSRRGPLTSDRSGPRRWSGSYAHRRGSSA